MTQLQFLTTLFALAGGISAFLAVLLTTRASNRTLPRLSVSDAGVGSGGLSLSLRNEGSAVATDVKLSVSGDHDGVLLFQHDALGPGSVVVFADICPGASAFEIAVAYRHVGGIAFSSRRRLQRNGAGPLRITVVEDRVDRRRLRDWMSDMLRR